MIRAFTATPKVACLILLALAAAASLACTGCDQTAVATKPPSGETQADTPGKQETAEQETVGQTPTEKTPTEKKPDDKDKSKDEWRTLFNGKDLTNWKSTNFGGEGEVKIVAEEKAMEIAMGSSLSGVTWTPGKEVAALPTNNYEIELESRRTVGGDFFCGLTFPYKETHASLILGGWGGGVVGISCIDHYDASENNTTTYHAFKEDQWYKVRLRVTEDKFEAWIDDKSFVDVEIGDSEIGIRSEVELSRPLGIATFTTTAQVRNIRLRQIDPAKLKEEAATEAAKDKPEETTEEPAKKTAE